MTSDNLEATLIDDSCFSDIFTMQSQFLDDFEFGLEANNIDSLLELFEEREKRNNNDSTFDLNYLINNNCNNNSVININSNSGLYDNKVSNNSVIISSPKVRKSTTNSSSDVSNKRKGTSLLAKPKKSSPKRSMININERDFHSLSSHLLQEHDYCLISEDNKQLYNKLPDYITEFSNMTKDDGLSDCSQTNAFDKIPDYIKGFLNLSENINEKEENFITKNDNILIELNETYIEVSDVFFDNEFISDDNKTKVYGKEDFNSNSDSSNYSNLSLPMFEESTDLKELNDILNDNHFIPQSEQNDYTNSSNNYNNINTNISNDKKPLARRSRSTSREPRTKKFVTNRTRRRRRLSTRSSVDSSSDSDSSRSGCRSSCSCDSYSDRSSNESKINFKLSNSIIRNESNEREFSRKRSLKESYCQKNYDSKVRSKSCNRSVNNVKIGRKSVAMNVNKDIEERKIIYVGKIPDGTTKTDVRHWFGRFGSIKEVSIHFRDFGDNYAFVTFCKRSDAFEAIEHANEDSRHPKFDLSFGGRRQFCRTRYEDLDYAEEDSSFSSKRMDFDALLRSTQSKLNR